MAKMMAARKLEIVKPSVGTDLAQQWANTINRSLGATVETILETGRLLLKAKANLKVKRGWLRMFKDHPEPVGDPLRIGRSTAGAYMRIAGNAILANYQHVGNLPFRWGHLDALSALPVAVLKSALAEGRIHPDMTRRQISAMKQRKRPRVRPKTRAPVAGSARIDRAAVLATIAADPVRQALLMVERVVLAMNYRADRPAIAKYLRDLADSVRPYRLELADDQETPHADE